MSPVSGVPKYKLPQDSCCFTMVKGGIEPLVFSIGHKDTRPVSTKKSKTPLSHVQSASPPSGGGVTSMVETFQKTYNKRASEQIYKLKMNIKQRSEKSDVYIQQEKLGQTALLRGAKKKGLYFSPLSSASPPIL